MILFQLVPPFWGFLFVTPAKKIPKSVSFSSLRMQTISVAALQELHTAFLHFAHSCAVLLPWHLATWQCRRLRDSCRTELDPVAERNPTFGCVWWLGRRERLHTYSALSSHANCMINMWVTENRNTSTMRSFKIFSIMAPYIIFEITLNLHKFKNRHTISWVLHACTMTKFVRVKMTVFDTVFPGISPCNSHTWLDMGLKLLARACPQNIIKVIKYFYYWVNGSDVARSQSSAMGQNDP